MAGPGNLIMLNGLRVVPELAMQRLTEWHEGSAQATDIAGAARVWLQLEQP